MNGYQFTSKNDAMNRRKHAWLCLSCNHEHTKKPAQRKRQYICESCSGSIIQYFPSQAELRRYRQLMLELQCGLIMDLRLQTGFPVKIDGELMFTYYSDFTYHRDGEWIIEDVKGNPDYLTEVFKFKRKFVEAIYKIKLTIV